MKQTLDTHIQALNAIAADYQIDPLEIQLLDNVCRARINYMSQGLESDMTRMMPPPVQEHKDRALKDLELKIDALLGLKKKKKIEDQEFERFLTAIINDVKAFSVFDVLLVYPPAGQYGYRGTVEWDIYDRQRIIEKSLEQLDANYRDYKSRDAREELTDMEKAYEALDQKYEETRQKILEIKRVLPGLNELVRDLEH